MANFTPTTDAEAIPTIIAMETLKYLPSFLGLAKFVSRDVDWTGRDFATYGDTLNIVKPGALSVKTKTAGTQTESQAVTAEKVTVSLDQHKYIELLDEDITRMLRKPDLQAEYARQAALKLAESVESYLFGLHASIENTITFDSSSDATVETSFLALRKRFVDLKVPNMETKGLFANSELVNAVLGVDKYSSGDYVQGDVIEQGALRKIYNIGTFESQNVATSGSPATAHNIALTRYGMVLVNRPMALDGNGRGVRQYIVQEPNTGISMRITEGYSQKDLGTLTTFDLLYGAAIADQNQIVEVEDAQ